MKYLKIFIPILILLAIGYFILEKPFAPKKEDGVFGTIGEFFLIDQKSIGKVEITNDDSIISLSRENDIWKIEKPYVAAADSSKVGEIIRDILNNPIHRVLKSSEVSDLSEYGLASTRQSVALYSNGNLALDLRIGDNSVTSGEFYAQKDGTSEVILTAIQLKEKLDVDPNEFRSRNLMNFNVKDVTEIALYRDSRTIRFQYHDDTGQWYLNEPEIFLARKEKIEKLLNQLLRMEVTHYLNEKLPDENNHGLTSPKVTVDLKLKGDQVVTLALGDTDVEHNGFYARYSEIPDEDFVIEASIEPKLKLELKEFRETSLFQIDTKDIASVDVRVRGAVNLTMMQAKNGKWQLISPIRTDISKDKLDLFFQRLSDLRPNTYIPPDQLGEISEDELGFESYKLKIQIKRKSDEPDISIIIGNEREDGGNYISVSDIEGVYILGSKSIDAFIEVSDMIKGISPSE